MPDAPLPARDFYSVVVAGNMNPAIHHPAWYLNFELIDKTEFDFALANATVVAPLSRFNAPKFAVVCLPDRWEVQTTQPAEADRILDLASRVFAILDHTPVGAFGFNFQTHRETAVKSVGNVLGSVVRALPLGIDLSADMAGQFVATLMRDGQQTTVTVAQSVLGQTLVFIHVNFHYGIATAQTPQEFRRFDLGPMLQAHFHTDQEKFQAYAKSITEGLPKIGGLSARRN
jgi:hypothetical protein